MVSFALTYALALLMLIVHTTIAYANAVDLEAPTSGTRAAPPLRLNLFWCTADVRPGETLMCGLGQLQDSGSHIEKQTLYMNLSFLGGNHAPEAIPTIVSPSGNSVSAQIPQGTPVGAMAVQVIDADTGTVLSNTYIVNKPELWWVQGDQGDSASPGGWIRLFGRGIALSNMTSAGPSYELREIASAISHASDRGDWESLVLLARRAEMLATAKVESSSVQTRLNLTSTDGNTVVVNANLQRLSTFSAEFTLPKSLPVGNYSVVLSNGQASTQLGWFMEPTQPSKNWIEVQIPFVHTQSPKSFRVTDFGCSGGINSTNEDDPTSGEPVD